MSTVVSISADPILQFFGNDGKPLVGGTLTTLVGGIPYPTYGEPTGTFPLPNPIVLNSRGEVCNQTGQSCPLYVQPNVVYTYVLQDSAGNVIWTPTLASFTSATLLALLTPDILEQALTQTILGTVLYPPTLAEISAGLTVTSEWYPPYPINVLRYGILPNDVSLASANGAILQLLLAYQTPGPTGLMLFPNTTGADVYSFDAMPKTIRQFVHIDLCGCTISIAGTATVNDVNTGFFYPLSDVIIENGTITTAVDTTLGDNAGACIQVGARGAGFYYTVFDSTQAAGKSLGRVVLRNLTLINNNTGGQSLAMIGMLGGLSNVLIDNVTISCNNVTNSYGIYYEWGWATSPPSTSTTQTSHGHNMRFSNVRVINAATAAIGLTGAYNASIEGLYTSGCAKSFIYSVGEAMFYLPWVGVDQRGAKRNISLVNIVGQGETSNPGIQLAGSNSASGTYLASAGLTPSQQVDLMTFTLDNVASGSLTISGDTTARNCKFDAGGTLLNPVTISDDCMYADFTDCQALNGTGVGVRANIAGIGVWSPVRQKYIAWRGGLIAGNVGAGLQFANTRGVRLNDVRIGYNALYDAQSETTQTLGVSVGVGTQGVRSDSCFVSTSGGNAYDITGTTSSGCNVSNPLGTVTTGGAWDIDGVGFATVANLTLASFIANTNNKYLGRMYRANSNKVFVAQGSAALGSGGGTWISTDGATTITPV